MSLHTNVAVHLRRRNSSENAVPDLNENIEGFGENIVGLADLCTPIHPLLK